MVTPRRAVMVTRVAMKACTLPLAMMRPLTPPSRAPAPRVRGTTSQIGSSMATMVAARAPHRASTEPTDRSMPAVRMTSVMPTAMMALTEVWRSMLSRLSAVKKLGLRKETTPISTSSATRDLFSIHQALLMTPRRGRVWVVIVLPLALLATVCRLPPPSVSPDWPRGC